MAIPVVTVGWTTTQSGVGSPYGWNVSNNGKTIRFDIQNSANCGGPNNNTQSGQALANFSTNANYNVYANLSGIGELQDAGYENMTLNLAGYGNIVSSTSKDFNQGCASGPVAISGSPGPYLLAANTSTAFTLTFTTRDNLYHVNCYYQCDLVFELLDPPVITGFEANKYEITAGETVALSWTTDLAESASIDQGIGQVGIEFGAVNVSPTVTTTYTLTATNSNGSTTQQVTITVYPLPVIDTFTVAPNNLLSGESLTATWTTTGASEVVLSGSSGAFPAGQFPPSNLAVDGNYTWNSGSGGLYTLKLTAYNPLEVKDEQIISFTVRDETPNAFEWGDKLDCTPPGSLQESDTITINGFGPTSYINSNLPIKSNYPVQVMVNGDGIWRNVEQI